MATRCNIVVKVVRKDGVVNHCQLYHHWDGYPSGVGAQLEMLIHEFFHLTVPDTIKLDSFVDYLISKDEGYEREDFGLHGDIEFIYVVEIDAETKTAVVQCESFDTFSDSTPKMGLYYTHKVDAVNDVNFSVPEGGFTPTRQANVSFAELDTKFREGSWTKLSTFL